MPEKLVPAISQVESSPNETRRHSCNSSRRRGMAPNAGSFGIVLIGKICDMQLRCAPHSSEPIDELERMQVHIGGEKF